jgi:hypothetical protein
MKKFIIVETKYAGPTNSNGSRILAKTLDRSARVTVSYDQALDGEANHLFAAQALLNKTGDAYQYNHVGYADTKNGYNFVFEARF